VAGIFGEYHPQVVFHAAAYKHVPLMEAFPAEAVKTNVFGTRIVVEEACQAGAEAFVMISTDKAVNPTSIMGATKRVAEMVVLAEGQKAETRCMAVRFGNVLGSRGSVIPTFTEQIKRGGPVTVTDPGMERYFMITAEAVLLVLQAGAMGKGEEVFVLDMGQPVKILDLARELIRFHGFEPDKDMPIVFTGIRPGEKLYEELLTAEEGTDATTHDKIFKARLSACVSGEQIDNGLIRLDEAAEDSSRPEEIIVALKELVPTYRPNREKEEAS
jgi:FlaA1/EpsC-like NDP-sugar epimerase